MSRTAADASQTSGRSLGEPSALACRRMPRAPVGALIQPLLYAGERRFGVFAPPITPAAVVGKAHVTIGKIFTAAVFR
jgi:hypothetical protein